ncbi:relaxase/mobilization nuclease domain-containing protein [Acinetobacter sp. WCHAc010034]|uniref:relaxase/mobilization nuclease domain-containing protein n=1 Tax=Acinetobacter sp. WCHAc010034 TaxID=1879049 RepID=UPI000839E83F|nr:mobilization protein [Acinetobacter sp. WCHAc010034]
MHIKFLDHGKGSPAKASAYLLDKLDHLGNVRAGIEVLKGDATTFNAICDSSPHLWKYTSGVIAWSKDDAPTDEQIKEVLDDFEKHAFSGLDPSQYHLFAVLHIDDDGSKHIHVLAPRLDIQSGKSLNIAPPGHEKHFDSLRDYFNTKYQWSRPDDLLLMQTTQEPNHIAKLNAQAKKILNEQDLTNLTKSQFCKVIDNYVKTLLKTQTVKNRAEIVSCIEQLEGVASVRAQQTVTVTLNNGKKHRLSGDFYHEQFEIGLYSERLRAEAESRPTANELAQAIRDAQSIRDDYRAKRGAYHSKQHAFTASPADDNRPQIASKLDIDRNRQSITPSHKRDDSELQSANRRIVDSASEYRYYGNIKSEIEHRFVFSLTSRLPSDHKPPVTGHKDRPNESREVYSKPSTASHSEPKQTNQQSVPEPFDGKIEQPESFSRTTGDSDIYSVDAFNQFLFRLSSTNQPKNNRSSKANDSTERTNDHKPNQLFEQSTEIRHADRNRPLFDRAKQLIDATKQLVSGAKQSFDSTSRFIKDHLDRLQRSRAGITGQNQHFAIGETGTTSLDLGTQNRAIQNRAGQLFGAVTANISGKLENPITNAISESIESTGFKQRCQRLGEGRVKTNSNDHWHTADRHREGTLENLAIESTNQLLRRFGDAKRADQYAWGNCRKINSVNQQLERLETAVAEIRLKPKPATNFSYLRSDGYYPDYVGYHKELCNKQQEAYNNKKPLQLIDYIQKKYKNLETYISRARSNIHEWEYDKFEKIIKNDNQMLKYLQCEKILEPQNDHLKQQRESYQACLKSFESINSHIHEIKNPSPKRNISQQIYEQDHKPQPNNDLDF